MPTEKYPGVPPLFWLSSLSPNHVWIENTTAILKSNNRQLNIFLSFILSRLRSEFVRKDRIAYHPTNLFRINMAAMGSVDDMVDEKSVTSPLTTGS